MNIERQYLYSMKLEREEPGYAFLKKISRAHLTTFPFENISKLIYYRDRLKNNFVIPSIETFIHYYHAKHFGGTCYTLNTNLKELLDRLGFITRFVMLGNEHMGILVSLPELSGEEVYVDCGAAAPFFEPVRFQNDTLNLSKFGEDEISLKTVDSNKGIYEYVRYTQRQLNGKVWGFNTLNRYEYGDFKEIIQLSNQPDSTFMTFLRCQLFQLDKNRSLSLVNNVLGIRKGDGTLQKVSLNSVSDIEEVLAYEFELSKLPVREAIDLLSALGIDIFSEG